MITTVYGCWDCVSEALQIGMPADATFTVARNMGTMSFQIGMPIEMLVRAAASCFPRCQ